jgi:hypothetical protein
MLRLLHSVLVIGLLLGTPAPLRAQTSAKRVWLRVYAGSRLAEARQVRRLLAPEGLAGGRLRQAFLRRSRGPQGTTRIEVLSGPFATSMDAVVHGLALRRDGRFRRAGLRLRSLAVLLPTSFLPLPLRIDEKSLGRLNPGRKKPYPELADLLTARAIGFSAPRHALPAMELATTRFTPWRPLLVLGEATACNPKHTTCLRWFEVLQPVLIRTAWLPAYLLALHRDQRRVKVKEGAGVTKARAAFWKVGRTAAGDAYRAMFRRGSLPPQLHSFVLADRDKPPFRLVVDKHGPGIYNGENLVVQRIKLRPWTYKRPPLWKLPAGFQRSKRRRPPPVSPGMGAAMRAGRVSGAGMRAMGHRGMHPARGMGATRRAMGHSAMGAGRH